MKASVFLSCLNDSELLTSTVKYYKSVLPSCPITVCDNGSTDNSVEVAKGLGCQVVSFGPANTSTKPVDWPVFLAPSPPKTLRSPSDPPLVKVSIFLMCFNESLVIPYTVNHYRNLFPSCTITLCDNESTDDSVEVAKKFGCEIRSFSTGNKFDERSLTHLRNHCWKGITDGWVIVADMDEWLCMSEEELFKEQSSGTTIITTRGVNMVGESKKEDLSDIDLRKITKCMDAIQYSKKCCFLRTAITDMNFTGGSHFCYPEGTAQYSLKAYINKHLNYLGLPYLTARYIRNFERSIDMRNKYGAGNHYLDKVAEIEKLYYDNLNNSYELDNIPNKNWTFFKGLDTSGYDIRCVGRLPLSDLIKEAESTPGCVAFNTLGYLKSKFTLKLLSTPFLNTVSHDGVYLLQTSTVPAHNNDELYCISICHADGKSGCCNQIMSLISGILHAIRSKKQKVLVGEFSTDITNGKRIPSGTVFDFRLMNTLLSKYNIQLIDAHDINNSIADLPFHFHFDWINGNTKSDFNEFTKYIRFNRKYNDLAQKSISRLGSKFNTIHIRTEDDAITHWSRQNKMTKDQFKGVLEKKYIDLISANFTKDANVLVLTSATDSSVIKYMKENGYNYITNDKVFDGREENAIVDLISASKTSGCFIGNFNEDLLRGSSFSYTILQSIQTLYKYISVDLDWIV